MMSRHQQRFTERYGPWAVVAGASEGLGAAFARALADRGLNLLLLARRSDALERVAAPLRASVEVRTSTLDLGAPGLAAALEERVGELDIGLCVYNAAYSRIGPFLERSRDELEQIVDVNCRGPLIAAHAFGSRMRARGRGGIILMSSLTALVASPRIAVYGASKAFNLSLGEALWHELGPAGVDVLVCCAGATRTPGFLRSAGARGPSAMAPEDVAVQALDALGRRPSVVPGWTNRLAAFALARLLPRRRAINIMGAETVRLRESPRE
ncbi:MAG: SDR family NAD(P)-dependent oxidoreductase [Myxococcales bacterium]|nr:SDR family NAD(P)-dependent oxidoreductase [Myxococcales bacterium]